MRGSFSMLSSFVEVVFLVVVAAAAASLSFSLSCCCYSCCCCCQLVAVQMFPCFFILRAVAAMLPLFVAVCFCFRYSVVVDVDLPGIK